jgi:hypothetical protein
MLRTAALSLIAVSAFTAQNAMASKNVAFSFRVHSYGARLYPCDAGIRNQNFPGDWLKGGYDIWTPGFPGSWGTGAYVPFVPGGFGASGNIPSLTHYLTNQIAPDDVSYKFGKKLVSAENGASDTSGNDKGLDFFLISDTYSSLYFVDFCYQGPQMARHMPVNDNLDLQVKTFMTSPVLTPADTDNYLNNSKLQVQTIVSCDVLQEEDTPDPSQSKIVQHLSQGGLRLTNGDAEAYSGFRPVLSTGTDIWNTTPAIVQTNGIVENCVIRYIFKESCTNPGITNDFCERKNWDGEHAKFAIDLTVEPKLGAVGQ